MIRLTDEELLNLTIKEVQFYAEKYAYLHNKDVNEVKLEIINLHTSVFNRTIFNNKYNQDMFDTLFNKKKK